MRKGLHTKFKKKVQQNISQAAKMKCAGKADRKSNKQGYTSNDRGGCLVHAQSAELLLFLRRGIYHALPITYHHDHHPRHFLSPTSKSKQVTQAYRELPGKDHLIIIPCKPTGYHHFLHT